MIRGGGRFRRPCAFVVFVVTLLGTALTGRLTAGRGLGDSSRKHYGVSHNSKPTGRPPSNERELFERRMAATRQLHSWRDFDVEDAEKMSARMRKVLGELRDAYTAFSLAHVRLHRKALREIELNLFGNVTRSGKIVRRELLLKWKKSLPQLEALKSGLLRLRRRTFGFCRLIRPILGLSPADNRPVMKEPENPLQPSIAEAAPCVYVLSLTKKLDTINPGELWRGGRFFGLVPREFEAKLSPGERAQSRKELFSSLPLSLLASLSGSNDSLSAPGGLLYPWVSYSSSVSSGQELQREKPPSLIMNETTLEIFQKTLNFSSSPSLPSSRWSLNRLRNVSVPQLRTLILRVQARRGCESPPHQFVPIDWLLFSKAETSWAPYALLKDGQIEGILIKNDYFASSQRLVMAALATVSTLHLRPELILDFQDPFIPGEAGDKLSRRQNALLLRKRKRKNKAKDESTVRLMETVYSEVDAIFEPELRQMSEEENARAEEDEKAGKIPATGDSIFGVYGPRLVEILEQALPNPEAIKRLLAEREDQAQRKVSASSATSRHGDRRR